MPDEEIIEPEELEEQLCSNIANLSGAFNSLTEIDGKLLSQVRERKLARMKRQIFDALAYYCDCLPSEAEEDTKPAD